MDTLSPPSLGDRLAAYSAAATAALALLPGTASAQIIYTNVNPDRVIAAGQEVLLDFDGDGTNDFTFRQRSAFTGDTSARVVFRNVNAAAAAVNGVVGVDAPYFTNPAVGSASRLAAGVQVAPANAFFSYGVLASIFDASSYYQFTGQEGYLGFRFRGGDGQPHFGWARISVDGNATEGTLFEYAYQATPNTPIATGAMGTASEPDALADGYRFSPLAPNPTTGTSSFDLAVGQTETVRVEAFDALGRSVAVLHDGPLVAGQTRRLTLDAAALPAGVYVVRVAGESFLTARRVTVAR